MLSAPTSTRRNLKLETGEGEYLMKEIYEMDVYRLSEQLSDMIWDAFDSWTVKAQNTIG